jgi:hypothetical protein
MDPTHTCVAFGYKLPQDRGRNRIQCGCLRVSKSGCRAGQQNRLLVGRRTRFHLAPHAIGQRGSDPACVPLVRMSAVVAKPFGTEGSTCGCMSVSSMIVMTNTDTVLAAIDDSDA